MRAPIPLLTDIVRASEWWEFKLAPILAAFYATALLLGGPVTTLWLTVLMLFASLVPGAAYVSILNDLTDRVDDQAAGKRNRLEGVSPLFVTMLLLVAIGAGVAISLRWRHDSLLLLLYLGAWLAFSLYSCPPFRLKRRGFVGVIADASGASLFPTLVAVVLVFRATGHSVDSVWLAIVGLWAFAYGVRGILWHQLGDRANDEKAGVPTFALRHSAAIVARLGTFLFFPIEIVAIAIFLWRLGSVLPALMLLVHVALVILRKRGWNVYPVIVVPKPRSQIVMQEYYEVLLPLGILLASSMHHPGDLFVVVLHLVLFPRRSSHVFGDVGKFVRDYWRSAVRRLRGPVRKQV